MIRRCRRPGTDRPGRRTRAREVGAWLAVALAAGCAAQSAPPTPSTPPAPPAGRPATATLVDADATGAILLDERGQYAGITRSGAIAWREPAGVQAYTLVSCLARCPDAALSASLAASNTATVADPVPRLVVAGQERSLTTMPGHKRRILTAAGADDLVAAGGRPGAAWLRLYRPGGRNQVLPVGGVGSTLARTPDARHALVVTSVADGGNEARWLTHSARGWRPVGTTQRVTGIGTCLAPDGSRALLLGQRPAVLLRAGGQQPLTDLESAGACAWARSGGIVAELAATNAGPRSRLRVFDASLAVRWRLDTAGVAAVTADPTGARVGFVVDRVFHEVDPVRGVELRTIAGVQAARYDVRGDLVTVDEGGTVAWRR